MSVDPKEVLKLHAALNDQSLPDHVVRSLHCDGLLGRAAAAGGADRALRSRDSRGGRSRYGCRLLGSAETLLANRRAKKNQQQVSKQTKQTPACGGAVHAQTKSSSDQRTSQSESVLGLCFCFVCHLTSQSVCHAAEHRRANIDHLSL